MMSDPSKFTFVGSILEELLAKVPAYNFIVNEYQKLPPSGARLMSYDLGKVIEQAIKLTRGAN